MHGWFSQKQKEIKNDQIRLDILSEKPKPIPIPISNIYLNNKGDEVEVTMVSSNKEHGANTYYLDDIEYIGLLSKWVRCVYK